MILLLVVPIIYLIILRRPVPIGMGFVRIPAGEFLMGDRKESDAKPHTVRISRPFDLGKYEVTQAQWEAVMGNNPSRFKGHPNRPVEGVSWKDAQEFIRRLNVKEGKTQYRLPTEAEWEYAARTGMTTAYSFGNDASQLGDYAWYTENSKKRTHPVGQKRPNAWGLHDMHGNVWELVQDMYEPFKTAETVTDPQGSSSGTCPVIRGGGFNSDAGICRSTTRRTSCSFAPGGIGFRLLRMVP
jgi:formylglycine-generating enzyme required for sulfatase activity